LNCNSPAALRMNQSDINNPSKLATKWFVQLSSGNASQKDYQAWQAWRESHPENEKAWQKIEQVTNQLKGFSTGLGIAGTLRRLYDKPHVEGRRRVLKQLAVLMAVGSASYLTYKQQPWQGLVADYATGTGARRELALSDGTRLFMNTSTAVDIAYDAAQRTLTLLEGEVLIETGHEQGMAYRPFKVKTQHGEVTALGTRFSVRDHGDFSQVSVFDGAVKVMPKNSEGAAMTLQAGEAVNFSIAAVAEKDVADYAAVSWTQGFIIVDQLTLAECVAELSRYRRGLLQCDPNIANILVSGSFPTDTDIALDILSRKFPIQIKTFTRYWTKVTPA